MTQETYLSEFLNSRGFSCKNPDHANRNRLGKDAIIFIYLSQSLFWKNFHGNKWDCSQSQIYSVYMQVKECCIQFWSIFLLTYFQVIPSMATFLTTCSTFPKAQVQLRWDLPQVRPAHAWAPLRAQLDTLSRPCLIPVKSLWPFPFLQRLCHHPSSLPFPQVCHIFWQHLLPAWRLREWIIWLGYTGTVSLTSSSWGSTSDHTLNLSSSAHQLISLYQYCDPAEYIIKQSCFSHPLLWLVSSRRNNTQPHHKLGCFHSRLPKLLGIVPHNQSPNSNISQFKSLRYKNLWWYQLGNTS